MSESAKSSSSLDILGVKPIADATLLVVTAATNGAGELLSRICLPAAEEFGMALKDHVAAWRAENANKLAASAKAKLDKYRGNLAVTAHPRIAMKIINEGTWTDDDALLDMWGGLLAASCDPVKPNDGNLIFVNLLSQLTPVQIAILEMACTRCNKYATSHGLIAAALENSIKTSIDELISITNCDDINRIDRELDHLRSLGLITDGIALSGSAIVEISVSPTPLCLSLYVACQGFAGSAVEYFDAKLYVPNLVPGESEVLSSPPMPST